MIATPLKNQINDVAALKAMTYIFPSCIHFLFSENRTAENFRLSPISNVIDFSLDAAIWRHFETHAVQPPGNKAKEKKVMFHRHLKHTLIILRHQVFALAASDPDERPR